jgi:hypothetical protein
VTFIDSSLEVREILARKLEHPCARRKRGADNVASMGVCRDGERFVTDDRFRFLSAPPGAPPMGAFDAESGVNPPRSRPPFTVHSANRLR